MPLPGGPSDLSAKRTSENLNTLCISCFALQRSLLQKTNNPKSKIQPPYVYSLATRWNITRNPAASFTFDPSFVGHLFTTAEKVDCFTITLIIL